MKKIKKPRPATQYELEQILLEKGKQIEEIRDITRKAQFVPRWENAVPELQPYHTQYRLDSYLPSRPTTGTSPLYGIELEIHCPADTNAQEFAPYVHDIAKHCGLAGLIRTETDGSLDSLRESIYQRGIEIITAPLAESTWKCYYSKLYRFLATLSRAGCTSHNNERCGLHVHISRPSSETTKRIENLVYKHDEIFKSLSRRKDYYYCKFTASRHDRYSAVNITPSRTIEIRFFRGTLRPQTFFYSLETVFALRKSAEKIQAWREFKKLVYSRKQSPFLSRYLSHLAASDSPLIPLPAPPITRKRMTPEERAVYRQTAALRKQAALERKLVSTQQKVTKYVDDLRSTAQSAYLQHEDGALYAPRTLPILIRHGATQHQAALSKIVTPIITREMPFTDLSNQLQIRRYRGGWGNPGRVRASYSYSTHTTY